MEQVATGHGLLLKNDDNPNLEIVNNINSNGINSSSLVAKFTARVMGQPWSGCESLHGFDIDLFHWIPLIVL